MADLFDPSAFIAAEQPLESQGIAENSYAPPGDAQAPKRAEKRGFATPDPGRLARIATLAEGDGEKLPWDDALTSWVAAPPPDFVRPEHWDEITHEALAVSRVWGATALAAGWTSLNLFGCHSRPQFRRLDHNGLVATIVGLLSPVRITALTSACAELSDHNGTVMRYRPRDKPAAVHLWEAYAMPAPP